MALLLGCEPAVEDTVTRVESVRVLAVRAEPAEAEPGQRVRFTALTASPDGTVATASLAWTFCIDRRPLSELAPVSSRCLAPEGPWLVEAGNGAMVEAALPLDGCERFGPNPPAPEGTDRAGRPVDPDLTGGFYQPLRVLAPGQTSSTAVVYPTRIACGLAGVTQSQAAEFRQRYRANGNVAVERLVRVEGDTETALPEEGAEPARVRAGAVVSLRVAWAACAGEGACSGAERYLRFDTVTRTLVESREQVRASWFSTGGRFDEARNGRDPSDAAVTLDNRFTAPTTPGPVTLWVVLRDDRGGVGWRSVRLRVEP